MADVYSHEACDERHQGLSREIGALRSWVKTTADKADGHETRLTTLEAKLFLLPVVGSLVGGIVTAVILKVLFP